MISRNQRDICLVPKQYDSGDHVLILLPLILILENQNQFCNLSINFGTPGKFLDARTSSAQNWRIRP